jgi:hypothetical protein
MFDESSWLLRRPPMWVRWALSLGIAVVLAVALIVFVSHHNGNGLAHESPKAAERLNREAETVVSQDQAPQVVTLAPGASRAPGALRAAVTHAIRRAMTARIAKGDAGAPLRQVRCLTVGTRAGAVGYRCRATAAGVIYPYQALLRRRTHTLTFCKHDAPPVPSMNIPVSPRCRL